MVAFVGIYITGGDGTEGCDGNKRSYWRRWSKGGMGGLRRDVRVRRRAIGREGGREGEGSINHRKKSLHRELRTWSQDTCHMQGT